VKPKPWQYSTFPIAVNSPNSSNCI